MYRGIQKLLTRLCYILIIALVFSYLRKDQLPDYKSIDQRLLQAPVQQTVSGAQFRLDFKGRSYQVRPRALYDLRGLVVSHNNPQGVGDIYHDAKSLDTKDLCVIWGHNVRSNEFQKISYWSNSWTCFCQWDEGGLRFWPELLSNSRSSHCSLYSVLSSPCFGYSRPRNKRSCWLISESVRTKDQQGNSRNSDIHPYRDWNGISCRVGVHT